jgi:hypothetical protein
VLEPREVLERQKKLLRPHKKPEAMPRNVADFNFRSVRSRLHESRPRVLG